jgi:acetyl esterase/lipase
MNKFLPFLLQPIFFLVGIQFSHSQDCRFVTRVFPQVAKISDVVYANVPSIPPVYVSENVTNDIDLKMDIWQPIGDTMVRRPMIVLAHGGGFISGTKDNNDMQYLADTFAHYGYVTASIDYRITLNATSTSSVERAIWRATQDGSAAIRFLKEKSALYGVDTNHIFVLGSSAGTFLWNSLLYCSNAERPQSTFSGFLQPDLGCRDCVGNTFHHNAIPKALVGCWGAIADTNWISSSEYVPTIMFHGDADPVVPYAEGYPFSALFTAPWVYGSARMHDRLNHLNRVHQFFIGAGQLHEYWGVVNGAFPPGPVTDPDFEDIIQKSLQFLYGVLGSPSCVAVSVDEISNSRPNYWWNDGMLFVNNSEPINRRFEIYTLEGKLIFNGLLNSGQNSINLPELSGIYVLKIGNVFQKLAAR